MSGSRTDGFHAAFAKDNIRFDSVWRNGSRVLERELAAARSGAYVLWREEKTSYRSYSCSVALSDPNSALAPKTSFEGVLILDSLVC